MKNITKYCFLIFLLSFLCVTNVFADCSYQERKEMLNKAKNIEAFFEADIENNKFVFYLYNLTDDLYVRLENPLTFESLEIHRYEYNTNYYSYDETNITEAVNYKLKIYSNMNKCYGNTITSFTIKKPIINKYYKEDICKGIEDFKYCKPLLENKIPLNEEKVYDEINTYKEQNSITEEIIKINKFGIDDIVKIFKEYWYILLIIVFLVITIYVTKYITKKRGEL